MSQQKRAQGMRVGDQRGLQLLKLLREERPPPPPPRPAIPDPGEEGG